MQRAVEAQSTPGEIGDAIGLSHDYTSFQFGAIHQCSVPAGPQPNWWMGLSESIGMDKVEDSVIVTLPLLSVKLLAISNKVRRAPVARSPYATLPLPTSPLHGLDAGGF